MSTPTHEEINDTIHYTAWTVFARERALDTADEPAAKDLQTWLDAPGEGVEVRGVYDVSGMREDADLMLWVHGPTAEGVQQSLRDFRRTLVGQSLRLAWSAMGIHRPAEFNRSHVPAFMTGKEPRGWLCVYPFVRSYEWYLLPADERKQMLYEHGMKGRAHESVLSNTVSAFALNDYEWILALESDQLHDLVDLMRAMRETDARRHVREEIPFYTGRRIDAASAVEVVR